MAKCKFGKCDWKFFGLVPIEKDLFGGYSCDKCQTTKLEPVELPEMEEAQEQGPIVPTQDELKELAKLRSLKKRR